MRYVMRYYYYTLTQVSKGRVQTCIINFYCSDVLFLKTQRNNQIQVLLLPFLCCISAFLLSRCILNLNDSRGEESGLDSQKV